jgi:hypothetical protein
MADDVEVIWVKKEQEYFCKGGWTSVSVICRSGNRRIESGLQDTVAFKSNESLILILQ